MLEHGYRLQMPIYALAAEKQLGRPVHALQFIALSKKGARNQGVFPVSVIGDEPGKLLKLRKNSRSYMEGEAPQLWSSLSKHVEAHLERYLAGKVRSVPKRLKAANPYQECTTCPTIDLCGQRRFVSEEEGEGDE